MFFRHLAGFASVAGGVKLFCSKGAALNILKALAAPQPLQSNDSAQGINSNAGLDHCDQDFPMNYNSFIKTF